MGSMSRWLDVEVGTDEINLNTLQSNIIFIDLQNDNEYKLAIGDLGRGEDCPKLKIFKGAMQISDLSLPDLPLAVVGFYSSAALPRSSPIIAIAFSSCVHVYRGLKLFYKYYLPTIELNPSEVEIWNQLMDPTNQNEESLLSYNESLKKIPEKVLSNQSKDFLMLNIDQQMEYLENYANMPQKAYSEIACLATLKMSSVDKYSVSCLVVGSEDGNVLILDPQTFSQLALAKICTAKKIPYQIVTTGLFNVDYRLTIATREKCVCLLKRGWREGRVLFSTEEHIIAIEVLTADNSTMVICADNSLACYSRKGKKQWCITLDHRPVAMTLVPIIHLGVTLIAVALASGHLHLFDGKAKRDSLFIRDVVSVMKFGQLGQEEHVFSIITASGNLMLKILKRTADFSVHAAGVEPANSAGSYQKPWHIPKKSKLFLEQSARERDNAQAMHESFQLELNKLRLTAAKTLLEAHTKSDNFVAAGALEPVRLAAEVEGLGPIFLVTIIVENTSSDKAVMGLSILYHVHSTNYKVSNPHIKIPLLAPSNQLKFPTKVEEVFQDSLEPGALLRGVSGSAGARSLLRVLLLKEGRAAPAAAAAVRLPPTDPTRMPYEAVQDSAFDKHEFTS